MISTRITESLGLQYPIISAGMAFVGAVREWLGREAEAAKFGASAKPIGHTVFGGETIPVLKFSTFLLGNGAVAGLPHAHPQGDSGQTWSAALPRR